MRILRLSALSGILIGTSYIPFPPWALLFCLVPLWIQWLNDPKLKSVFFHGWVAQFLLTIIGFHWIAYTAVEFGHLPWAVGILVVIGFATLFHWHLPVSGLLWAFVNKRWPMSRTGSVFFMAASFAFFETVWPMIFPWNLGYTWLWSKIPLYHWADVVGFNGLSAFAALMNAFFFFAWENRKDFKKALRWVLVPVVAVLALSVTGYMRNQQWKETDREIKILAIQANIGNLEKYWQNKGDKYQEFITDKYISIATEGLKTNPNSQIMVFPETAIPIDLDLAFSNHYLHQRFTKFIEENKIAVLSGAYSGDVENSKAVYNAVFNFGPLGNYVDVYRKNILLAFGEYFPGAETFPILKKIVPAVSDFGRGREIKILKVEGINIGPQICYEGLYPHHSRELSSKGAQIFFNATNDSWYGLTSEPYQHLYMTLGRAIEFRRPLMRVTNTGITTAMLADGTVLEKSPFNTEWSHQYTIAFRERPAPTAFEKWGKYLPHALLLLLILFFIWGRHERLKAH